MRSMSHRRINKSVCVCVLAVRGILIILFGDQNLVDSQCSWFSSMHRINVAIRVPRSTNKSNMLQKGKSGGKKTSGAGLKGN